MVPTQPAAPIEDRVLQQQLASQLQKAMQVGQLPDTTPKAMELAAKGIDPSGLIAMFHGGGTPSQDMFSQMLYGQSNMQTPSARESLPSQLMSQGIVPGETSGIPNYKPGPMLPKGWEVMDPNKLPPGVANPQQKAFGLTSEQIAALTGLMPKYQEPKLATPHPGPASQVRTDALTLPKQAQQRVTLADILRGGR